MAAYAIADSANATVITFFMCVSSLGCSPLLSLMARRVRRPNLDTVLKQAEKVGRPVKSITFMSDGGFTLVFVDGESTGVGAASDVDQWFSKNAG